MRGISPQTGGKAVFTNLRHETELEEVVAEHSAQRAPGCMDCWGATRRRITQGGQGCSRGLEPTGAGQLVSKRWLLVPLPGMVMELMEAVTAEHRNRHQGAPEFPTQNVIAPTTAQLEMSSCL